VRRIHAVVAIAVLALALVPGAASAKTYRAKLKGQPFGPYELAPRFSATASLTTGRNAKLRVSAKKHIKGTYKIQLRKAKGRLQPCKSRTGKGGKGRVRRGVGGWRYDKLKVDNAGTGKASGTARRFSASSRSVYYVVIYKGRNTVTMCGVIAGKPKRG
jgi:hypothetical protein